MNTHTQSHTAVVSAQPDSAAVSPAGVRLAHNRQRLADWLAQDRAAQAQPSLGGWAARAVLPLIDGLRQHPAASLALGAMAQAWLRPLPAERVRGSQALESQVLGAALTAVRRHPKTTLAVVALAGAAWWWSRTQPHPSHPL